MNAYGFNVRPLLRVTFDRLSTGYLMFSLNHYASLNISVLIKFFCALLVSVFLNVSIQYNESLAFTFLTQILSNLSNVSNNIMFIATFGEFKDERNEANI